MANLKLNIAAITGSVAETNVLNEQSQAADLDGIKAKFRERLMACVNAREEVRRTIQEQLPFILANAHVSTSRWGNGDTDYFVGEDLKVYDDAADGYEKDRYDLKITCRENNKVVGVEVDHLAQLSTSRLGVKAAGYIGCAYGHLTCVKGEAGVDRIVDGITRETVGKTEADLALAEEYYEKVYLPMVGILFAHIRDRAARLAAQLKTAEDKACPKVTHRIVIEIAKVG